MTRYSRWDGTQLLDDLSPDDLMKAMSDELMQDGDLMNALRRLFWEGIDRQDGEHVPGLRDLRNRLRDRRQEQLGQHDLGSILEDIREQLRDVVETERSGIERRLQDAAAGTSDQPSSAPDPKSSSGGQEGGESAEGQSSDMPGIREALERMAASRLDELNRIPDDPAGSIRALQDYDFIDPSARQKFQDLLASLQQQVLQQTFEGMEQALSDMSPEQIQATEQMMRELNEMLEARDRGEDPQFQEFMHKWGHMFGPNVKSLDDLLEHMRMQMAAMQQVLDSMSPEQRDQLRGMMQAVLEDPGIQQQMQRLQQNLMNIMRPGDWRDSYEFRGDESLTLQEAMRVMDRLSEYDELEDELRNVRDWSDFANLDDDKISDLLGDDFSEQMEQLSKLTEILEDAGYARKTRGGMELTPRGVRKIGEKALNDIFAHLKRDRIGQHDLDQMGGAGERTDVSKPYEFGDPFLLDLESTVMNGLRRQGAGTPIQIEPGDFDVYRTERTTRTSTVLMIDMSRSMFYSDSFVAAKRIALALDSLIRSKYPRDSLDILGFSYIAEEIKPADLPAISWNEYQYGTNMQHGFQIARTMLARHPGSNHQIIIITDGEPTAHIEEGRVDYHWPPLPQTLRHTLKEVLRCTRDGIQINTFMLEQSPYMMQFVDDLMRINNGRVFFAAPGQLGEYILIDYVENKRKLVN